MKFYWILRDFSQIFSIMMFRTFLNANMSILIINFNISNSLISTTYGRNYYLPYDLMKNINIFYWKLKTINLSFETLHE